VRNTTLTGTFMPLAATATAVVLAMLVNAPLRRWRPAWVLGRGEMAVVVGMMLVGSSFPNVGLMRYLPGHIIGFYHNAAREAGANKVMEELSLPAWPFVDVAGTTAADRGRSPAVVHYDGRSPDAGNHLSAQLAAVPWGAWVKPIVGWGVFIACLCGAVICLLVIFRPQWADNERLPFPIAGIYSMLLEEPRPGRILNRLLSARSFWIAVATVFAVRAVNGLHAYNPGAWPQIPLSFDLRSVLADDPWRATSELFRTGSVSFTMVGIAYFLQSRVSLSLWLFFVILQVFEMAYASRGLEIGFGRKHDLLLGSFVPYGLAILWVARHHLAMIARQMFGHPRPQDRPALYLPHPFAGWGLIGCATGLVLWLVAAGASAIGAAVTVAVLLATFLMLARIVAETGLHYVTFDLSPARLWLIAAQDLPGGVSPRTTGASYFWANTVDSIFLQDKSQAHPPHVANALRVADHAREAEQDATGAWNRAAAGKRWWRLTFPVVAALALALVASYGSSFVGSLWAEYSYAASLDRESQAPINAWGSTDMPKWYTLNRTAEYLTPRGGPIESHSRPGHVAAGAALSTALSVLRLRYAGWPLHPVGLLLCTTYSGGVIWFSMLVAWLAKAITLRLGGPSLYRSAQPMFVGLVIGDACAGIFWVLVTMARLTVGLDYTAIRI